MLIGHSIVPTSERRRPVHPARRFVIAALFLLPPCTAPAQTSRVAPRFSEAKTFFQTNSNYDPRIALAVDAVVVHMSGRPARWPRLSDSIAGWHNHGYRVGRMFFADS